MISIACMSLNAQNIPANVIKSKIDEFKEDTRGPYYRIKWFCDDGSIREARDPCPDSIGGGIQHATYKPEIIDWQKKHHLFIGDILAATDQKTFWDASNDNSRLKQYQLQNYLAQIDDGWVLRRGQFYRGAKQAEDEAEWGLEFYDWLLYDRHWVAENFYLIRQSLRDIPHHGEENLTQLIRTESKIVADAYTPFMDMRVKIHGNPTRADIDGVTQFREEHAKKMSDEIRKTYDSLQVHLNQYYKRVGPQEINNIIKQAPVSTYIKDQIKYCFKEDIKYIDTYVSSLSDILCFLRVESEDPMTSKERLALLELSLKFEDLLLKDVQEWNPPTLHNLIKKNKALITASAGTGLLEMWEFDALISQIQLADTVDEITVSDLSSYTNRARQGVAWASSNVKSLYEDVVALYGKFESKSHGFIDDKIRSSVALPYGQAASALGGYLSTATNMTNDILNIKNVSGAIGLNPGIAKGELVIIESDTDEEDIKYDVNKIYAFARAPSDLKPVAGILAVSEGNLVSHVQLLARNLAIPNISINDDLLSSLKKYEGEDIFVAVNDDGVVRIKLSEDMNNTEAQLYKTNSEQRQMVTVDVQKIKLDQNEVLDMRAVGADDSGILCGPKAANLGELKSIFPDHVVEGIIIPFGVFRAHLNQTMPNSTDDYWCYLNETFAEAEHRLAHGTNYSEVEAYQLDRLSTLRDAMDEIQLTQAFVDDLKKKFEDVLGKSMGSVPVFLRSDTNMEDLESFTGAGLNLTLFNIVDAQKILDGIKKVWASPYTERSFKWRQQYLTNPENVFPSILIIPSVDVTHSGVLITKGINEGTDEDLTLAFSRGAGGAVDGQMAEMRLVTQKDNILLNPSRSRSFIRLPKSGGVKRYNTDFTNPILTENNIISIREIVKEVRNKIPERTDSDYAGAYDIELGFEDEKLFLFQIRPFVENDNARISEFLVSLSPKINRSKKLPLYEKIEFDI